MTWQAFNELNPAEVERLALCMEEMGEAIQAIGKVLRHGYESCHPAKPDGPTNRMELEKELGHVRHAMIRLCDAGDLSKKAIHAAADVKAVTVNQYLHEQHGNQNNVATDEEILVNDEQEKNRINENAKQLRSANNRDIPEREEKS